MGVMEMMKAKRDFVAAKNLKAGKKVEKEHADLVKKIRTDIEKDGKLDMTDDEIYEIIAAGHVKESDTYYDDLKKYVEKEDGNRKVRKSELAANLERGRMFQLVKAHGEGK